MEILGLDWHAWVTLSLLALMFVSLARTKAPEDMVFFFVIGALYITGCLDETEALSGFCAETVIVVGVLSIVVAGLEATGFLQWLVANVLGTPRKYWQAILRLMLPVAALSAFMSNTTVVLLFVRVVKMWAKKLGMAPSKLLIPLSYAAGMGGVCTLIGTPPNLIIAEFYHQSQGVRLGLFSTTVMGVGCLVAGVLAIIVMQKLLPSRVPGEDNADDMDREIKPSFRTVLSSAIMVAMVILSAMEVIPLLECCFLAAMAMVVTRCCTLRQAKDSLNGSVLMVFACSVSLGKAIEHTGLAELCANSIDSLCAGNALLAFCLVCTMGTFVTEFISNTACGAIMAPVAIKIALAMGANPLTFCMGLMVAVSSSFATPIGSPTHLLVYNPGGYRLGDFLRIGIPMNFIVLAANIIICLLCFPL